MLRRLLAFVLFLLAAAWPAYPQAPAPLASVDLPIATDGPIFSIVFTLSGKIMIGGAFQTIGGVARPYLARLNSDGTLDNTFNVPVNGIVRAIVADNSSNVYFGGDFTAVGATPRNHVALADSTGVLDNTWNPNASGAVLALARDTSTGNIFVSGLFTTIGGQSRLLLARLSGTSGFADPTWNPSPDNVVNAMAFDGTGNLYVGGAFGNVGGGAHPRIARLNSAGGADATWTPTANADVNSIAITASGLYIGGDFTLVNSTSRNRLAALNTTSPGALLAWNPNADGEVRVVRSNGISSLYVGGSFTTVGGVARRNFARISTAGVVDPTVDPSPNGVVNAIAGTIDRFYIAGGFTTAFGTVSRRVVAVVESTGAKLASFQTNLIGGAASVFALARQADGKVIAGGDFGYVGESQRNNIFRMNADGTHDTTWNPDANGRVTALAIDAAGNVFAGGDFTTVGGVAHNKLARIAATGVGAADATWAPVVTCGSPDLCIRKLVVDGASVFIGGAFTYSSAFGARRTLAKTATTGTGAFDATFNANLLSSTGPDGFGALAVSGAQLYISGDFDTVNGTARRGLARVSSSTGALDASWTIQLAVPSGNNHPKELLLDGAGNLYLAGHIYSSVGGAARTVAAKIAVAGAGTIVTAWNPVATGGGYNATSPLAFDGAGNVVMGGSFTALGALPFANVAKLSQSAAGDADPNWAPQPDGGVHALLPPTVAGSSVLVAGDFETIGGQARTGLALVPTTTPDTRLGFASVNGGTSPVPAPSGFSVVVQAQGYLGAPENVTAATNVGVVLETGTGTLGGTTTCQIPAGQSSCTINGMTYSKPEANVVLRVGRFAGDALLDGLSNALTFKATPTTVTVTTAEANVVAPGSTLLTATVSGAFAAPSGSVAFREVGGNILGSGTIASGKATFILSSGNVNLSLPTIGAHNIRAEYVGDTNYVPANSSSIVQRYGGDPTVTLNASATQIYTGQSVTFTVQVTGGFGAASDGTITFMDGSTSIGMATVVGGTAQFVTSFATTAGHPVVAHYNGGFSYGAKDSNSVFLTANNPDASTTTLSSSKNPSASGEAVIFTVVLFRTHNPQSFNGTVVLKDGAATITSRTMSGGNAVDIVVSTLTNGLHAITAAYSGDVASYGSTSNVVSQQVGALDPAGDADGDGMPNGVEAAEGRNPVVKDNDIFGSTRWFAMQQYRDFLGREGDAGGIDFYTQLLNNGTLVRANVVENFFNSPEFQGVGSPVARLYFATFLRIPDYAGLEFQIDAFRSGTPLPVIANNFTASPEFLATYGSLNNTQFVVLLYQNILGRTPVQGEIDFHVNRLVAGATRGEVLVGFSESPEYQASTAHDVYVTMMYVGMLRRAPDPAGFAYWVDYMDAGNPGLALILGFLNAPEYHNRFLP